MPDSQRAWLFKKRAEPSENLSFHDEWPISQPTAALPILVRIKYAALNPVGWKMMTIFPSFIVKKPGIPESDFSGVIAGGHLEKTGLEIGDEVFGIAPAANIMRSGFGTLADYTIVKPEWIVKKPSNLSFEKAAAIPLAGLTASLAIFLAGKMRPGDRLFINGASGGVGSMAVQIANAHGVHVVASCSPRSQDFVRGMSPAEVIDYQSASLVDSLSQKYPSASDKAFDLVLDTVGSPALYAASPRFIKPSGQYVDIGADIKSGMDILYMVYATAQMMFWPKILGGTPIAFSRTEVRPSKEWLQKLADLAEQGKLDPKIDSIHEFKDVLEAYKVQMSGRALGKVVVKVS